MLKMRKKRNLRNLDNNSGVMGVGKCAKQHPGAGLAAELTD